MRTALLPGRDFGRIGAVELVAEGPCAIAISRGGAAKNYSHTDPNEDACMFATGRGGTLIAVADGHHGALGAELAVTHLLDRWAEQWTGSGALRSEDFRESASEALAGANGAILAEAERCELPPAPTTISIALIRPAEDLLLHASVGDSHVFCIRSDEAQDLGWAAERREHPHFLGDARHQTLTDRREIASESLRGVASVILVTDGFSETGIGFEDPISTVNDLAHGIDAERAETRAVRTCRNVAEATVAIQRKNRAGDNIACAVWSS